MAFIDNILRTPPYGWRDEKGELLVPAKSQLIKAFFDRVSIWKSRKNWIAFTSWFIIILLLPFFILHLFHFFSWKLLIVGFLYSMVGMGCQGTLWFHRYGTHKAYSFSHVLWRFVTAHLTVKTIIEEAYIVPHHVHHALSDKPGDPHNPRGGWLYCFLADASHHPIRLNLSEHEYQRVAKMLTHTGVYINSYAQYKKWGSVSHPFHTWRNILINWLCWFMIMYAIGGVSLAVALFGWAAIWTVGIRTFNYDGHGGGKDKRKKGVDFYEKDLSVNQLWPGYVAGEWHNNHHLFPNSARSGFRSWQLDLPWLYIKTLHQIGGVKAYTDSRDLYYSKFYIPYKNDEKKTFIHLNR